MENLNELDEVVVVSFMSEAAAKYNWSNVQCPERPAIRGTGSLVSMYVQQGRSIGRWNCCTCSSSGFTNGFPDVSIKDIVFSATVEALELACPERDQILEYILPYKVHEVIGEGIWESQ